MKIKMISIKNSIISTKLRNWIPMKRPNEPPMSEIKEARLSFGNCDSSLILKLENRTWTLVRGPFTYVTVCANATESHCSGHFSKQLLWILQIAHFGEMVNRNYQLNGSIHSLSNCICLQPIFPRTFQYNCIDNRLRQFVYYTKNTVHLNS